jgi:hypothetical protein
MDKIQELKKKHYNVKETIKNHLRRKTDCKKQVEYYLDICQQLREFGIEVNDTSSYIKTALEQYEKINSRKPINEPIKNESESVPEESIYKITLAWTERPGREPGQTIKIIEDYLTENGARKIEDTPAEFDGYTEVMRSYEWIGGDKEFTILRKSANYILDVFAVSQYEKFNISIFGNKKK